MSSNILEFPGVAIAEQQVEEIKLSSQPGPQTDFLNSRADICIYGGSAGSGKCIFSQTPICTSSGWTTMGQLRPGDMVYAPDGQETRVVAVSPIMYGHQCYEVEFDTGEVIVADAEHLWPTLTEKERAYNLRRDRDWQAARRERRKKRGTGKKPWLAELNSKRQYDYLPLIEPAQRTTEEILQTLVGHCSRPNHSIEAPQPITGREVAIMPIDPYLLGLWLGDGFTNSGCIAIFEQELVDNILARGESGHFQKGNAENFTVLGLCTRLRNGGLLGYKHVPYLYLRASYEQRLELLRGLMDTDGTVSKTGTCEFLVTKKRLAEDVLELVHTFGIKATMREGRAKCNGKDCGPKYRIQFSPSIQVFALPRKMQRLEEAQEKRRVTTRRFYIVDVRPVPSVPVCCITVDSPTHCFMVGKGMIPTHNSRALLMEAARHYENPGYGGMIFRRTFPEITMEGGLWDESLKMYSYLGGRSLIGKLRWKFPSGAQVTFGHIQHDEDKENYRGSQIAMIGFDQLEEFSWDTFIFMLSRNRSMSGVKPYVRATCNPDADSWLADFLSWWIDQDTGYPVKDRGGAVRWFVNMSGELIWDDDPQELLRQFPENPPKSASFIPATIFDNQILLKADPGYLANLKALPPVEQERFLWGNWKIRPEAGKVFNRSWFDVVEGVPHGGIEVRFWDFAATAKEHKDKRSAATAGVKMRRVGSDYYITDVIEEFWGPAEADERMVIVSKADGMVARQSNTAFMVRWEQEGGSSGTRNSVDLMKKLAGLDARGVPPRGDKFMRSTPLATQAMIKKVHLVKGSWNEHWLTHMHNQPNTPLKDIMDASSGAFQQLTMAGWSLGAGR